jgi:hypothetical protein
MIPVTWKAVDRKITVRSGPLAKTQKKNETLPEK